MFKQDFLPGIPDGAQKIGRSLSILEKDGRVTYFVGSDNYFSHRAGDDRGRRLALASLMENRHVRARDLEDAPLRIPHRTLMHRARQLRDDGADSFYRVGERQKPRVMTPEKRAECATLLASGVCPSEAARRAGIKEATLRKAIKRQAVPLPTDPSPEQTTRQASTKSCRSREDAEAANGMGTACTRADERVAAAMGMAQCATARFETACDVQFAGLMTGLPALCANGLLSGIGRHLHLPRGFYSALHILIVLGFMALGRIRRPEHLGQIPPGEFGKVVGLDRAPEKKTLRQKVSFMARHGDPEAWMKELGRLWMEADPDEAGYLYIDGHVRVYSGSKANLPRRFVSREKLCLRGVTDYWLNDAVGRPFFVVSKAVTEGLADTLVKDIVPELLASVPQQPTPEELERDPDLHRFVIVFDREGSTHKLFSDLWQHRIGALTYRKNVKDVWPESEFVEHEVPVPGGGSTRMLLAMRETRLAAGRESMPVTEVRRLTSNGHQTAVITSAKRLGNVVIAGRMFARWCQENFFAYMMEHYDIDGLVEYGAEEIPGTITTINPAHREIEKEVKKARMDLQKLRAKLAKTTMAGGTEIQENAELVEEIQAMQGKYDDLVSKRRGIARKVPIKSLPVEQRPTQLLPLNKILTDSVKMIAYRAETALVERLRKHLNKEDEARALVRELFVSAGDIEPDEASKTRTIRIHRMANPAHDRAVAALFEDLNKEGFCHPESGAKMIYTLV